jgi:hypothetical protein
MLLPAVQMAREVGRRSICMNNLHQLSVACLNHSQKLTFFPGGGWGSNWVGNPDCGTGRNQPGGWIYQILPYMDQDNLHDLGKGGVNTNANNAARLSIALPILYCPTRRQAAAYPLGSTCSVASVNPSTPLLTNQVSQAGRTDYAINGGSIVFLHGAGPSSLSAAATYTWPVLNTGNPQTTFNGIASVRSQVTDATITDTKDTTYLVAEKYMSPENYMAPLTGTVTDETGFDPGDELSALSGDDISLIRWGNTSLLPSQDRTVANNPPQPPQQPPSQIFGSSHGAGWHAAFCGGNVQLIGWAINGTLHQTMATINGVRRLGYPVVDPSQIPH